MEDTDRALVMGALLKRIGNYDMSTFEGRLILQKTVYLLQSHGLYLGYKFSWYVHGPYCPALTREAFELLPISDRLPHVDFSKRQAEKRFGEFLSFLEDKKYNADWLEQLACTHFLRALNPRAKKEEIINIVLNHEPHFTRRQCEQAWDRLVKNGLIKAKKE